MLSLLDPLVALLHSALVQLSAVLPGGHDLGVVLALVLLTVALKAALLPLSLTSHRAMEAKKALAPELTRIQKRYSRDKARLGKELATAYRKAGVRPTAGLGAMVLQLPAPALLYRLVTAPADILSTASLLGTPLSSHWLPALSTLGGGPMLLAGLMLTALLLVAHLQARKLTEGPRLIRLLPYSALIGAALAPVAFTVYLLTSSTWTLVERAVLPRLA